MRVFFMLAFTRVLNVPNPVLVELFDLLRRRSFELEIGIGEELLLEPARFVGEYDLYVLKSHAALWLSIAGMIHSRHGRILNPYQACLAAHNKIVGSWWLHAAGIPTPQTWITGDLALMRLLAAERPLIIKPYIGGRGVGVRIVQSPDELQAVPPPVEPVVIQEFIPTGDELKVYVIGRDVFGIRKYETPNGSVRMPAPVSSAIESIALRVGQLFGMGLYGLDLIEGPHGPLVVDVNYFPSYKGVPGAAPLIADYIDHYAHNRIPELISYDTYVTTIETMNGAAVILPGNQPDSATSPSQDAWVPRPSSSVLLGPDLRYRYSAASNNGATNHHTARLPDSLQ